MSWVGTGVVGREAPQEAQKRAPVGASEEQEGHCDIRRDYRKSSGGLRSRVARATESCTKASFAGTIRAMSIEPGQTLLHYRIVEKIGEGGMGVVWKAVDTTLDREVAIKVLPEAFAGEAERLARFEREAKVLASLNHPNIAGVYGLHQHPSTGSGPAVRFLAMEMVAGEELAQRIDRGPMPLAEALNIGGKIAEALEAAHAAGVVHRDLKPANVKLTPDGKVKVLDFGLAKALGSDPGSDQPDPGMSPTLTSVGTVAGMILGTAAYMSPEQARGQAADARADVWAFGVVLFEMLVGKRLFHGKTVSDTLASVLKIEPDWKELPGGTPPAVRRLLRRCLAKEPEDRLHHIADARIEIRDALAGESADEVAAAAAPPEPAPRRNVLPWAVAALGVVIAAVALWLGNPLSKPAPQPSLNLAVPFPAESRLYGDQLGNLAISPSGSHLAVILIENGVQQVYLRALDDPRIAPLEGTDDATMPFFSPDSRWLGFIADGKVKKVSVEGGTPLTICDAPGVNRGADWGPGDVVVFAAGVDTPLSMVLGSGGTPRPITTLDEENNERTHRWPHVMPDGDAVLFTVGFLDSSENYEESPIDAVRISTGERKTVLEGASFAQYVESGHLVFARGGFLFAVPFDPDALEVKGTPVPVMEDVMGSRNSGLAYMDVSANGLLAFVPGQEVSVQRVLAWAYPDGTTERLAAPAQAYNAPRLAPDGRRAAVTVLGDTSADTWIYDIERETMTRLTFEGNNFVPIWSPDGKWIAFSSDRGGRGAVYRKPSDGSGDAELLLRADDSSYTPNSWSPDGRYLAVDGVTGTSDITILSIEDGEIIEFLYTDHDEYMSAFSPDGKWIAYRADESGRYEIYVRPFPGPGGKWQISVNGGAEPYWSKDGSKIFFRDDEQFLVVDVETSGGSFRAGRPRVAVEEVEQLIPEWTYSVDANGERFLKIARAEEGQSGPDRVVVVVNWFDELRRRVAQ
jgi:serine/threonine-protein kinase